MTHYHKVYILVLIILLSATSSCASASPTTLPSLTQTSAPLPSSTSMSIPTIVPTQASSLTPNATQTATPIGISLYLPIGIAILPSTGGQVAYYDLQGQLLGDMQSPNLGTGTYQQAHIAGPLTYSPDPILPPLVYYAFQNGGELWLNDNHNLSLIKPAPNLFNITGVPGKPTLSYSLVEYTDIGVRTRVYLGDLQTLPTADTVLDSTNSKAYAIKPMAISIVDDQPTGIWYTTVPYGIGGDIVFEPRSALFFLDLLTYATKGYLDLTKGPVGISDDRTWVAYTSTGGAGPLSIDHNFDFSTAVTFPLRADSDRGSGDAVFSPDNQFIAWREVSGSLMEQPPTLHQTIRIGTLDGIIISEIPKV